jgi:hypothetical protein
MDHTNGFGGIYVVNPETGEVTRSPSDARAPEPEPKATAKPKPKPTATEALTDAPEK